MYLLNLICSGFNSGREKHNNYVTVPICYLASINVVQSWKIDFSIGWSVCLDLFNLAGHWVVLVGQIIFFRSHYNIIDEGMSYMYTHGAWELYMRRLYTKWSSSGSSHSSHSRSISGLSLTVFIRVVFLSLTRACSILLPWPLVRSSDLVTPPETYAGIRIKILQWNTVCA